MRILLSSLMILAAASFGASAENLITNAGRACCVIITPNDATPGEKYAAEELRSHIIEIAGVELRLIPESYYSPASGPCISIGRTNLSRRHIADREIEALGDDGYRVFTRKGNLFFAGGRRRGAMYAVYEFLESLGVRWYSPDYTVVPKIADIRMPADFGHVPQFRYRDQWWNNGTTHEWLARMRVNGSNGQDHFLPEAMGGSAVTMHSCHSYATLVPPAEHFSKRPEWFALKEDGNRSAHELCLTNPELREFLAQRVLSDLRSRNGKVDYYWVSQNDGGATACFCERCTAERVAHGGNDRWSANNIGFASHIADLVKQEFPNVLIKTLAYNYTRPAPEKMTASDRVLVEICGNFKPGDDAHRTLVRDWSKVARNISVYTYGGSNYGYWWPYPNVREHGMQYPWALESGVTAFYVQGTAIGKGAGLVDMKAYISARMAWDPSRDVRKEIRAFADGFYGPAGKHVVEYLDWYSKYIADHGMVMDGGWGNDDRWRNWVTKEAMERSEAIFAQAIDAVKDQPIYLRHVRRAYLEVLCGSIMIDLRPGAKMLADELSLVPDADESAVRAKLALFREIMRENGYDRWSEIVPFEGK